MNSESFLNQFVKPKQPQYFEVICLCVCVWGGDEGGGGGAGFW